MQDKFMIGIKRPNVVVDDFIYSTPTENQIKERAYFKWIEKGSPLDNDHVADWLNAEYELREEFRNQLLEKKPSIKYDHKILSKSSEPFEYEFDYDGYL